MQSERACVWPSVASMQAACSLAFVCSRCKVRAAEVGAAALCEAGKHAVAHTRVHGCGVVRWGAEKRTAEAVVIG